MSASDNDVSLTPASKPSNNPLCRLRINSEGKIVGNAPDDVSQASWESVKTSLAAGMNLSKPDTLSFILTSNERFPIISLLFFLGSSLLLVAASIVDSYSAVSGVISFLGCFIIACGIFLGKSFLQIEKFRSKARKVCIFAILMNLILSIVSFVLGDCVAAFFGPSCSIIYFLISIVVIFLVFPRNTSDEAFHPKIFLAQSNCRRANLTLQNYNLKFQVEVNDDDYDNPIYALYPTQSNV